MTTSYAERDAAVAGYADGMSAGVNATVLGYGDPQRVISGMTMAGLGAFQLEYDEVQTPITVDDVTQVLSGLDTEGQALLALDLLAVGVYDDINYMFDDNNELDQKFLVEKVNTAITLAATSQEFGLETDFLDVLLRNYDSASPEELAALIAEKKAAARSGGGGRIINYIDPVALVDAAKKASSSVTGRMATPAESQAFVKMIHGLQASGATGINVGARAEAFARDQAPEEAKAMDYANAAGVLMQALGIRGR